MRKEIDATRRDSYLGVLDAPDVRVRRLRVAAVEPRVPVLPHLGVVEGGVHQVLSVGGVPQRVVGLQHFRLVQPIRDAVEDVRSLRAGDAAHEVLLHLRLVVDVIVVHERHRGTVGGPRDVLEVRGVLVQLDGGEGLRVAAKCRSVLVQVKLHQQLDVNRGFVGVL